MKYSQYSSKSKGSAAFYIIIAVCLVLIGTAAWFAFSRMNNDIEPTPQISDDNYSDNNEYFEDNSSYNEITSDLSSDLFSSEIANETVDDEPYEVVEEEKSYTMPVNGEILKDFNATSLQYSVTFGDLRIHDAVDIACADGTLVTACCNGIVQSIEESINYGNIVTIDHGDGLVVKYAGLKDITVKKDQVINIGDNLGTVTTIPCESSDQAHIHLEAYQNGESISILKLFD